MRLFVKEKKDAVGSEQKLGGKITFWLKPLAKALLYKVEELKIHLMETYGITMEEDYVIRQKIRENALKNNGQRDRKV
jgi:hypothetical protein